MVKEQRFVNHYQLAHPSTLIKGPGLRHPTVSSMNIKVLIVVKRLTEEMVEYCLVENWSLGLPRGTNVQSVRIEGPS